MSQTQDQTTTYTVKKSDYNALDASTYITLTQGQLNDTATDLTLVGRSFVDYGQAYNQNILHLLENFASPEASTTQSDSIFHAIPTNVNRPIDGQVWFNSTRKIVYQFFEGRWSPIAYRDDVSGTWGTVLNGQSLPKPVRSDGSTFNYTDCAWVVSPAIISAETLEVICNVDPTTGVVTATYKDLNGNVFSTYAFYQIIGLTGSSYLSSNNTLRALLNSYLVQTSVPALHNFPATVTSAVVNVTAVRSTTLPVTHSLQYTWILVSPTSISGFPTGMAIAPAVGYNAQPSPNTVFNCSVSTPSIFPSTQTVTQGATFVCRVDELDENGAVVNTTLSLPLRVEFNSTV